MAHARRKLYDAQSNNRKRSKWMLKKIQQLYGIESIFRAEELNYAGRFHLRQEKSLLILNEMES